MQYALVLTDITNHKTDRVFTYRVPQELSGSISVGMRVVVPFGSRKFVDGYVLGFSDTADIDESRIKPIARLPEAYPILLPQQIQLAYWIKEQYHTVLAQAVRLMVPSVLRKSTAGEKSVSVVRLNVPEVQEALRAVRPGTKKQAILEYLSGCTECAKSELAQKFGSIEQPLKQLCADGIVTVEKRRQVRSPYKELTPKHTEWLSLKREQQAAFEQIRDAIDRGDGDILLHGVTGSGKTEVYMRAIRHALESGGSAIMLIPEISLTPQTVGRFRERFGRSVAVLHSALGAGERYDEWQRIRSGEARVVVGARSAIFAPCTNLKLIIIDEAHESSYIAGSHPAYSAVEVARKLARLHGGILVLGSATPSVEQYYSAQQGEYKIVNMTTRINGRALPRIEVVDMAAELASGNKSVFSRQLYKELQDTVEHGRQAILFLNRRGHSTVVTCRSCGETVKCPNCDIAMTYHLSQINSVGGANRLRCHYCGSEMPYPKVCPSCGSKYIKFMGAGTEKVEEECEKLLPGVRTLRMDNDTTRGKDSHYHILSAFAKGEAQILIGTQMIAKGLDFPKVSLVGIVSADTMLQLPDYTSREKTFSLITQVAGRAGRADTGGTVILQSYTPKHYAIADAVAYSYEEFYQRDLEQRRRGMYPPFSRMLRLVFMAEDPQEARSACYAYFLHLRQEIIKQAGYAETALYFNMMTAPIGRIRGQYRYQILLKMRVNEFTEALTDKFFELYNQYDNDRVYLDVEVNPSSLY